MKQAHLKQGEVAPEFALFGALLATQCSCEPCDPKCNCSQNAWLERAKAFVRSYSLAVVEARVAAPDANAWWSASSDRPPVPTLSEYLDLVENTPGVSVEARAQMTEYLDRRLPGYDKVRGRSQDPACAAHMGYFGGIALHYSVRQAT